jgi:arogenate dehydrogenase (NADP+)
LGLDLAINNQKNILKAIKEFKKNINEIESLIKNNKWELLSEKLTKSIEIRSNFTN